MQVTDELFDKIANLSRLEIKTADREAMKQGMQKMVGFVEKLNELDTTGAEPVLHMSLEVNVLRADEVKGSVTRNMALQNAPTTDDQFFKVPKVIRK
jgi:aspartyl-tRNA(Asn)/glutamyl-tRNA(Gln) amidotransferase subunit C